MKIDPVEAEVEAVAALVAMGIEAHRIAPSSSEKRPDLCATDGYVTYAIEVKTRSDRELVPDSSDPRSIVLDESRLYGANSLTKILTRASDQLSAAVEGLRLVWYRASCDDWEFLLEQLKATLYGSVDVLDAATIASTGVQARPCYFWSHAAFRKLPNVDGVVACFGPGGRLHPNPFSERVGRLQASTLYRAMEQMDAVTAIHKEEQLGLAYVLDGHLPDYEEATKLEDLRRRYGLRRPVTLEGMARIRSATWSSQRS